MRATKGNIQEKKQIDGCIICRKCAKWAHEISIGRPEKALDYFERVFVSTFP
jgi:hypothetical protein